MAFTIPRSNDNPPDSNADLPLQIGDVSESFFNAIGIKDIDTSSDRLKEEDPVTAPLQLNQLTDVSVKSKED